MIPIESSETASVRHHLPDTPVARGLPWRPCYFYSVCLVLQFCPGATPAGCASRLRCRTRTGQRVDRRRPWAAPAREGHAHRSCRLLCVLLSVERGAHRPRWRRRQREASSTQADDFESDPSHTRGAYIGSRRSLRMAWCGRGEHMPCCLQEPVVGTLLARSHHLPLVLCPRLQRRMRLRHIADPHGPDLSDRLLHAPLLWRCPRALCRDQVCNVGSLGVEMMSIQPMARHDFLQVGHSLRYR